MANSVVRARIDARVKEEATAVLAEIGLTVSDAFRLMMIRIANDKAMPFQPLIPNAKTVAAMREDREGLPQYESVDRLFTALDEED